MASINMKSLVVGEQPPGYDVGDAYHYILMRLLMAARAHDLQVIDGPYLQIKDLDGFRRVAGRSAALGFDGKWTLHPSPDRGRQRGLLPAARATTTTPRTSWTPTSTTPPRRAAPRGAVMLGDEMIDEASRKMALVISGKGRAAGMQRGDVWTPPQELSTGRPEPRTHPPVPPPADLASDVSGVRVDDEGIRGAQRRRGRPRRALRRPPDLVVLAAPRRRAARRRVRRALAVGAAPLPARYDAAAARASTSAAPWRTTPRSVSATGERAGSPWSTTAGLPLGIDKSLRLAQTFDTRSAEHVDAAAGLDRGGARPR